MATKYVWQGQQLGSPRPGKFYMWAILDFADDNAAQNDVFRILKLKKGWYITDTWYKILRASTSGADWEIGYNGATTDIADVSDVSSTTEWTHGSETPASPYQVTADKYVEVKVTAAAETAGKLAVMVECFAGFDDAESPDMDIN